MKRRVLITLAVALVIVWASVARANILTETLTLSIGNAGLSGFSGPYGTVGVTLDTTANTATFVFTRSDSYLFTDGDGVDLNFNTSFTHTFVSATSDASGAPTLTATGSRTVDGFGTFTDTFTSGNSSPSGRFTTATLSYTNVSANTLADLLAPNLAAAHIYTTSGVTGFARAGTTSVPEPSTMILLGLGLAAAGAYRMRKKAA